MSTHYIGMPARAPKQHQIIGQLLTAHLMQTTDRDYWFPIHEANLDDSDEKSLAPDVTVFDTASACPVMIIEITHRSGKKQTVSKCRQIMADSEGEIKEAFVVVYKPISDFDYEIVEWVKLTPDSLEPDDTFSELLDIDLGNMVYEE